MARPLSQGSAALAALLFLSPASAQAPAPQMSVEERLAAVERSVAGLDTRVDARTTAGAGSLGSSERGLEVTGRVQQLERELASVTAELDRLRRQIEAVTREANEARRTAMAAERLAQQNANRIR